MPRPTDPDYRFLVIGLLGSLVITISTPTLSPLNVASVIAGALCLIVTSCLVAAERWQAFVAVALGTMALVPLGVVIVFPGRLSSRVANVIYALDLCFWIFFTLLTTVIVFRGVMRARRIRANEVYGSIYVYILIGVLFAQIYQLLLLADPAALYLDPGRFAGPQSLGSQLYAREAGDIAYYSFVSLTTVGYGDVTPASPLARALSVLEALIGVIYVATMIARMVSIESGSAGRESEPR